MKYLYHLFIVILMCAAFGQVSAQSFTNMTPDIGESFNSGGCVGVTDMDNDGYDDIIVLHNSRHLRVVYQTPSGWDIVDYGTVSSNNQWGFAIGDVSETGHRDVVTGGSYDGVRHIKINEIGDYEVVPLSNGNMFMQACNVVDIDNDGHLDYFACHDDDLSRMWRNDGDGNLAPANDLFDLTNYDFAAFPDTDHSGNYGSVWSDIDDDGDLDLVIAKCRQFVSDPLDPRRINQVWINDGNGNFTEEALDRGLVFYEQSWTVDFADINNDGFFDALFTNHSGTMRLLLNDGTGHFDDITAEAGLEVSGFFLQAKMVDFDNDGFVDLVYSGGVHRYYRNNGDNTFTHVPSTFPYTDTMHSFGIGDLNKDGFPDLYASYGNSYVTPDQNNPDILWMNDANENNWIAFDLTGTTSNSDAIGAKIKLYGDWGVQIREVRAGESYGIVNSFHLNFGLGQNQEVDLAEVLWPSGNVTIIQNPDINMYHQVIEGECVLGGITIATEDNTTICPGETATISAPEGYNYLWNNGATTQSIEVGQNGFYSVVVFDDEGCAGGSNSIGIELLQPSVPTITVNGELDLCEGGSVELIASSADAYEWSNGADTQVIEVTEAGVYSVGVVDICEAATFSESVEVFVYDSPSTPVVEDVFTADPNALLELDGALYYWYDSSDATEPLHIGSEFELELFDLLTEVCVEEVNVYGGEAATGGEETFNLDGGQFHTNSNFWLVFDAHTDIVLESVKVFAASTANRTIALVDNNGVIIDQLTVQVPEGEQVVELFFDVPEGTGYGLRSLDNNPQLWRDGTPAELNYPYALGELATITTSSVSGSNALNFYYFFYDWKVTTPKVECASERECFFVHYVSVEENSRDNVLDVYPNPARDVLTIEISNITSPTVELMLTDLTGRMVERKQITTGSIELFTERIDVSQLASGAYQLTILSGTQQRTVKVMIDK